MWPYFFERLLRKLGSPATFFELKIKTRCWGILKPASRELRRNRVRKVVGIEQPQKAGCISDKRRSKILSMWIEHRASQAHVEKTSENSEAITNTDQAVE